MSGINFRPDFQFQSPVSPVDAHDAVVSAVEAAPELGVKTVGDHFVIRIDESQRHFWSPWLNLEIRKAESGSGSLVHGRFSPHPSIWTGFMFAWLAVFVLFFFSLVVGFSQQMIESRPWGYYLLPVWVVIGVGLWLGSRAGQRLSHDEMQRMKQLVDQAVQRADAPLASREISGA